jgi:hypothetical protein
VEPRREARPDALAAALADGATIDWRAAEGAAGGAADANLIHQLRVIAAMRGRQSAGLAARRPWLRQAVVAAFVAGVTLAAIKVIVAFAVLPAAIGRAPSPAGLFALNLGIFGVGGLLLVFGGSRDRRLQLLGGLYLTIAASFVDPFFAGITGPAGMIVAALAVLRPESMFALGVWLFAWSFPSEPLTRRARLVAGAFIAAAAMPRRGACSSSRSPVRAGLGGPASAPRGDRRGLRPSGAAVDVLAAALRADRAGRGVPRGALPRRNRGAPPQGGLVPRRARPRLRAAHRRRHRHALRAGAAR